MAEDGEENQLATVQHIVQTLGSSDTMTEDILKVFSNYDGRLSPNKIYASRGPATTATVGGVEHGIGERSMPPSPSLPPPPAAVVLGSFERQPVTSMERTVCTLDRQISMFIT